MVIDFNRLFGDEMVAAVAASGWSFSLVSPRDIHLPLFPSRLDALFSVLEAHAAGQFAFVDFPDLDWVNSWSDAVFVVRRDVLADSRGLGGFLFGKALAGLAPVYSEFRPVGTDLLLVRLSWQP